MATICGGSLAMMDAGIPVKTTVAGVATELVKEGDERGSSGTPAGKKTHDSIGGASIRFPPLDRLL
jgi:hypothetical protein